MQLCITLCMCLVCVRCMCVPLCAYVCVVCACVRVCECVCVFVCACVLDVNSTSCRFRLVSRDTLCQRRRYDSFTRIQDNASASSEDSSTSRCQLKYISLEIPTSIVTVSGCYNACLPVQTCPLSLVISKRRDWRCTIELRGCVYRLVEHRDHVEVGNILRGRLILFF